ncbi:alpha-ketoglutarate decarboxylase [Costertonia aggregata]|uniref:Alpha-ketoglutarate decarboxylase n=1 Tax=Costertonia aggregata TaxID=343403 RepID=A0A7H9AMF1_9FLAO|nr:alpha-ketoglutarate decarboxylase [Costertonia aggregata]QLG44621.1 alpha-ketoglutarate decarboxylase [Costertonia aggregata]
MTPLFQKQTKILFLGALFLFLGQNCIAQKSMFWENVRFGGGLGLGFTNGGFNGFISPSAIYQFNDRFAAGTSLSFNYAKFDENTFLAYGGSILSLYNPLRYVQLSAEVEQLRINRTLALDGGNFEDNYWSPAVFFGVGYTDRNFTVGIRYNILHDNTKSIYANAWMPFVRVFF